VIADIAVRASSQSALRLPVPRWDCLAAMAISIRHVTLDCEDAPNDHIRDEEVERLLGLGAGFVADHRHPDGTGWVVLADPAGNEFCVLRGKAEREGSAQ
jgi:hypothetical protein